MFKLVLGMMCCMLFVITPLALGEGFDVVQFCKRNKPFQDILINNRIVCVSECSHYCNERYDVISRIIRDVCGDCKGIRVLDVGAAQGYFSFRLAHDFNAHITMLENGDSAVEGNGDSLNLLKYLCEVNAVKNAKLLTAPISHENLVTLGQYEQFEIIIALNIVHFFKNWRQITDDLCALGSYIIIEVPSTEGLLSDFDGVALEMINRYLIQHNGRLIARISRMRHGQRGNLYLITREKEMSTYLQRVSLQTLHDTSRVMQLLGCVWPESMGACDITKNDDPWVH